METMNGRLTLPHGVGYSVIVLPERTDIPLSVLTKLEKLVLDGATVLGPKPNRDTTLADYPRCDEQVKAIANRIWGDRNDKAAADHSYGKGRVIADRKRVREILQQQGIGPDFAYSSPGSKADLDYIHRRTPDSDIYFVTNTQMDEAEAECTFRVPSRVPQFWYPDTAEIKPCTDYARVPGGMKLKLRLPPAGSVFVVFSGSAPDTTPTPAPQQIDDKTPSPLEITGPWQVRFPPKLGAPPSRVFDQLVSWTTIPDDGIKFFSGTATYLKDFDVPATMLAENHRLELSLGQFRNVAEATLNGKPLGILWKPPFTYDVTGLVRSGKNELKIEITNVWANRLVGDAKLPREKRVTRITQKAPIGGPLESGLLGPVQLRAAGKSDR
jgi:hypothetical protein